MTTDPGCRDDVCVTCSDHAVEVTIVELLADRLAVVDNAETVSVALVEAGVGDRILVHAGEAIAKLNPAPEPTASEHRRAARPKERSERGGDPRR